MRQPAFCTCPGLFVCIAHPRNHSGPSAERLSKLERCGFVRFLEKFPHTHNREVIVAARLFVIVLPGIYIGYDYSRSRNVMQTVGALDDLGGVCAHPLALL